MYEQITGHKSSWSRCMKGASKDGTDHINVYSKGQTRLGKMLSNFYGAGFCCREGYFSSVAGYWYWLSCKEDELRGLYGWQAKKRGRELRGEDWPEDNKFKDKIKYAIKCKIVQNLYILQPFKESVLPFKHYYVHGDKMVEVPEGQWVIDFLEELRIQLK